MDETLSLISKLAVEKIPFIFIIDYACRTPLVLPVNKVNSSEILYDFNGFTNVDIRDNRIGTAVTMKKYPVSIERYSRAFNYVREQQRLGNSYLTNLTFPTRIDLQLTLRELFHTSRAKYRLWYRDDFVVFSPETFIAIRENTVSSFPMKGTIDASVPDAEERILGNEKEMAEHVTIVDLIRNDLSMVAKNVTVRKFRYIDTIKTNQKPLLQVSSEIAGDLPADYRKNLGEILMKLLPAGSVTGAPKPKTLEIIARAENYDRGFYTGVCGYYDGDNLDSGVMIRFIQRSDASYVYKSGGGITMDSRLEDEYQEMIDKVYVPVY
ncbi:MAG: aminodeoxychorismate synthase component I [Candidatus Marinimicrobia bacterium]|nr:aminodeoxychorismate synthase component I [Candidatus Neomarinimicrobiota bacterium]